jgi:hypothetical protein
MKIFKMLEDMLIKKKWFKPSCSYEMSSVDNSSNGVRLNVKKLRRKNMHIKV